MAEGLENELSCAICTDVLYQPLTLLDCLHTFCGSCLKEWFTFQASPTSNTRQLAHPYTCPSCREAVRGTKVDWRANTLLEGFLKACPGKGKTEPEKEEMRKIYKPGDDVLKPVQQVVNDEDSEDERLMAEIRELSMTGVDPETARRRAERTARHRRREQGASTRPRDRPEDLRRQQDPSRWAAERARLTESRLFQHNAGEPQVAHQSSLRSLLSASDASSPDMQAEILQSIYAEGVLDGIDLDHLTTEQEEELTDRIAEAYRRRQQQPRDRSRNRDRQQRNSRSPRRPPDGADIRIQEQARPESVAAQQQFRARPPISRPHLFEQNLQEPARNHQRSTSATSQRSNQAERQSDGASPASRSATDLSQQPSTGNVQRERRSRLSSSSRSVTDPENGNLRDHIDRLRAESHHTRSNSGSSRTQQTTTTQAPQPVRAQTDTTDTSSFAVTDSPQSRPAVMQHAVRPAMSTAAFAPEPTTNTAPPQVVPSTTCNRCGKRGIQHDLHYNCSRCLDGHFNLCLRCYRNEQGCNYWFGFGFRAWHRWYRNAPPEGWPNGNEPPHVLNARRYTKARKETNQQDSSVREPATQLQEGAFCEICLTFANDCYWYCEICLEGAWGFCDDCVHQGRHCTHPLLLLAHISTLRQPHYDPTKVSFVDLPHLRHGSYVTLPPTTHCDICHRPIPPNSTRFHCYNCNNGDYDMCNECYRSLVAQGKINQANGPDGWRRCLQGHRMAVIGYHDRPEGGHLRTTVSEPMGGWDFKENEDFRTAAFRPNGLPPPGGVGSRCLAIYKHFPDEGVTDELAFPRNAEIREVKNQNGEWYFGVYAGSPGLFPSNHVRIL